MHYNIVSLPQNSSFSSVCIGVYTWLIHLMYWYEYQNTQYLSNTSSLTHQPSNRDKPDMIQSDNNGFSMCHNFIMVS